jgi:hypothetical protein
MTTPIPPGIASPDEVETRLGTLHFSDGCPDKATTETLNDKKWPFLVNRIERELNGRFNSAPCISVLPWPNPGFAPPGHKSSHKSEPQSLNTRVS